MLYTLSKDTFIAPKMPIYAKNVSIRNIEGVLAQSGIFSETTYLCVLTYQISAF